MRLFTILWLMTGILHSLHSQSSQLKIKEKTFLTSDKRKVSGEIGYLEVPENRNNPDARIISVKFIRLKSLSANPKEPLFYLEGGGSTSTWQAENPEYLKDWLPILEVSDIIFVDQRGTGDRKLTWIWKNEYPENFLISEEAAHEHYQKITRMALDHFKEKSIDVQGYNVIENAKDIDELRIALGMEKYSIFGFSYGSHLGMAIVKLFGDNIANAVFAGTDGLNQSFNYPSILDEHFKKISRMASEDEGIKNEIPDLEKLFQLTMEKLSQTPAVVEVKNPLTNKTMNVKVGPFGLGLVLRLDIDDANDIPIIPRLLHSVYNEDYSLLKWFVQKRFVHAFGVPGNGLNQGISVGASSQRWNQIEKEASNSPFGNVVNFPFSAAKDVWPESALLEGLDQPVTSNVRALFISGDLDCRTPVLQTEELREGFTNSTHLIVENAGHEQAMWNAKIFDEGIVGFLKGEDVSHIKAKGRSIRFISIDENDADLHPSLAK